jgi:CheY-like chemotaxis protein
MSRKILVVDDSDLQRYLIVSLLGVIGFECDSVDHGEKAVPAIQGGNYGAVLLDFRMPGMDGMAVLKDLRVHQISIPVAVLTCYKLSDEQKDELKSLGAQIVHDQTLTLPSLLEITNQLLNKDASYGRRSMERITSVSLGGIATACWGT